MGFETITKTVLNAPRLVSWEPKMRMMNALKVALGALILTVGQAASDANERPPAYNPNAGQPTGPYTPYATPNGTDFGTPGYGNPLGEGEQSYTPQADSQLLQVGDNVKFMKDTEVTYAPRRRGKDQTVMLDANTVVSVLWIDDHNMEVNVESLQLKDRTGKGIELEYLTIENWRDLVAPLNALEKKLGLKNVRTKLKNVRTKLKNVVKEKTYEKKIKECENKIKEYETKIEKLTKEKTALNSQVRRVARQNANLLKENKELSGKNEELNGTITYLRQQEERRTKPKVWKQSSYCGFSS